MSIAKSNFKEKAKAAWWLMLFPTFILLLAACGPSTPPQQAEAPASTDSSAVAGTADAAEAVEPTQEPESQRVESAYPPPALMPQAGEPYPVETLPPPPPTQVPDSYPSAEEVFEEPRFQFDGPLTADSSNVTGQAPPNLSLAIADISSGGELLGTGVSDAGGRFDIGVSALPEGHQVGITFAALEPGKSYAEMSEKYFPHRGDGFMNVPNIGIFFVTAVVQP